MPMTALPADWSAFDKPFAYPAWMDDALCAQIGGDEWHPEKGGATRQALAVCWRCPVREECLEYALVNEVSFGIWGGVPDFERRKLRAQRRAVVVELKPCAGCEVERPRTEFYRTSKGGLQTRCKVCVTTAKRQAYAEQRELAKAEQVGVA